MGIENIKNTCDRIKLARPESQIAVYRTKDKSLFRSMFASTATKPDANKSDFVGTFYGPKGSDEFKSKASY